MDTGLTSCRQQEAQRAQSPLLQPSCLLVPLLSSLNLLLIFDSVPLWGIRKEDCHMVSHFSHIQLFVTLWTIAHQAWDSPDKHTGEGCHSLLQGIFPTLGSNLHRLHWKADSLSLSHQGGLEWRLEPHI